MRNPLCPSSHGQVALGGGANGAMSAPALHVRVYLWVTHQALRFYPDLGLGTPSLAGEGGSDATSPDAFLS